jgi:uncharacterized membrane protein
MANAARLARGVGWFSLGLALPQVAAPRDFAQAIGLRGDADSQPVVRLVGLRELACGIGIVARPRSSAWFWARVAGDVMDLALLGWALSSDGAKRNRTAAAAAAVVGITVQDLLLARQLGRAGRGKGIHVTQALTVNRPVEDVYRFWRDFQNLPRFMHHLESVQATGERRSHWKAKAPAGRTVEWDAEMVEDRPNDVIAWRSLKGADVDNAGSVRFAPAPGGRGTEVRVELRYNPPGGAIGAAVAKLFGEEPEQQLRDDLRAFKQVLETGEVVHSEASIHGRPHPARPAKGEARR